MDLISSLIQYKSTSQDNIQHWRSILRDQFTHLHLIDHNILSPNIINIEHVNSVFLSSRSVFQLLHSEDTQSSITHQLILFFYDLLKFYIQYALLNEKVSAQPDVSIPTELNTFKEGIKNEYCSLDYLVQMIAQQKDITYTAKLNDDQMSRIVLIEFIYKVFQYFFSR